MNARTVSLVFGIVFVAVAVLGFVPAALQPPPAGAPELTIPTGYGYLLGLFPVNVLHNLVHLLFGLWGLFAYRTFAASQTFLRSVAVIYTVLGVLGLVPALQTTFGLIPIHGHDVWLHFALALVAAIFGWQRQPVAPAAPAGA